MSRASGGAFGSARISDSAMRAPAASAESSCDVAVTVTTLARTRVTTATKTISERLSEAAGSDFVGRAGELALIGDAVASPEREVVVVFVHGP